MLLPSLKVMAKIHPLGILVNQWEVKTQQRPFDPKQLYVMMHEWIIEEEYVPSPSDTDFPEISYYESRSQQKGKEIWAKWRCFYVPQDNPFYRNLLNVDIHGLHLKPVDVVQDGKKFRLMTGEIYITCQAILELDWQGKWRKHWLLKHLLETFWKRVFWKDLEKHKQELYKLSEKFNSAVKDYMEVKKGAKSLGIFWSKRGIKTEE